MAVDTGQALLAALRQAEAELAQKRVEIEQARHTLGELEDSIVAKRAEVEAAGAYLRDQHAVKAALDATVGQLKAGGMTRSWKSTC